MKKHKVEREAFAYLDTKPSHTPTPWSIGQFDQVSIDGKGTADSICVKGFSLSHSPEAKANAAFIVRAVNSHEELVQALVTVVHMLKQESVPSVHQTDQWESLIAKAEGK